MNDTTTLADEWFYKDNTSGHEQGPFTAEQMQGWSRAGFFPPKTPVKQTQSGAWQPISQVDWTSVLENNSGKKKKRSKKKKRKQDDDTGVGDADVQARIAALREQHQQTSIDDRIAALRAQDNDESEVIESSVDDRIAALREQEEEVSVDDRIAALRAQDDNRGEASEPSVDDRIAALRKAQEESVDDRIAALRDDENEGEEQDSVDARIAALKAENATVGNEAQEEGDSSAQDRIDALRNEGLVEQQVPSVFEATNNDNEVPSYPLDLADQNGAPEEPPTYYPLPDDLEEGEGGAVAPYPNDLDYPVNNAYPVDDGEETSAYPYVVAPYPAEDVPAYPVDEPDAAEPPKKVFKGDKALIGLVPTNLRKRHANTKPPKTKPKAKPAPPSTVAGEASTTEKKSIADDYESFMKEIGDLK